MNEIVNLLDEFDQLNIDNSDYLYDGHKVPRVTKIISTCIHSEGLMYWANSLGFKHQSYSKSLSASANIGTQCHNTIDRFLNGNENPEPKEMVWQAKNAYESYQKWYNDVTSLAYDFEVLEHEHTLVCKYFGGTLDGLYRINGKIYLIDYKTSNHITVNYCLQTAAYRYMLREIMNIEVDGIIILQLSKDDISYKEHVLNFSNPDHLKYINDCEQAFFAMVYWYYNLIKVSTGYDSLNWEVI